MNQSSPVYPPRSSSSASPFRPATTPSPASLSFLLVLVMFLLILPLDAYFCVPHARGRLMYMHVAGVYAHVVNLSSKGNSSPVRTSITRRMEQ
ncbi:hypothetical protein VTO73DRAFT_12662 [Trametes versicolor]